MIYEQKWLKCVMFFSEMSKSISVSQFLFMFMIPTHNVIACPELHFIFRIHPVIMNVIILLKETQSDPVEQNKF